MDVYNMKNNNDYIMNIDRNLYNGDGKYKQEY